MLLPTYFPGIPQSCQDILAGGRSDNYVYRIDPDGAPTGQGQNVEPYLAVCKFNKEEATAVVAPKANGVRSEKSLALLEI